MGSLAAREHRFSRVIKRTVLRIIEYVDANPHARDNVVGVTEWWIRTREEETVAALAYLCQQGFLKESQHNGQVLFSRNPDFASHDVNRLLSDLG